MINLSVGMLGSIMVASPEALAIDDDMCAAILRSVRGIEVDTHALDLRVMEQVVTGDGHYLGTEQTLSLMRSEYVYPTLGDRRTVTQWQETGSLTVWDRAIARVSEILSKEAPQHLSVQADKRIRQEFEIFLKEAL